MEMSLLISQKSMTTTKEKRAQIKEEQCSCFSQGPLSLLMLLVRLQVAASNHLPPSHNLWLTASS